MLGPVGRHQERFGPPREHGALFGMVENKRPYARADARSTGLSADHDRMTETPKPFRQQGDLGGLARRVGTLEGDEHAGTGVGYRRR